MPHRIHPAVKGVQPAARHPVSDRPLPDPESQELPPSHDPVLLSRQPGDRFIDADWDGFGPYSGSNPSRFAHAPMMETEASQNTPPQCRF